MNRYLLPANKRGNDIDALHSGMRYPKFEIGFHGGENSLLQEGQESKLAAGFNNIDEEIQLSHRNG